MTALVVQVFTHLPSAAVEVVVVFVVVIAAVTVEIAVGVAWYRCAPHVPLSLTRNAPPPGTRDHA